MKAKLDSYLSYLTYKEDQLKKGEPVEPFEEIEVKTNAATLNVKPDWVNPVLKFKFSAEIYDEKTSTLKIFGSEIKIPHGRNSDYLCRVIFLKYQNKLNDLEDEEREKAKQGSKEWGWDEISEMSDGLICSRNEEISENERWRVMYNAAKAVNDLIEKKTQAKDFFLTKPIKMVKINPRYLL